MGQKLVVCTLVRRPLLAIASASWEVLRRNSGVTVRRRLKNGRSADALSIAVVALWTVGSSEFGPDSPQGRSAQSNIMEMLYNCPSSQNPRVILLILSTSTLQHIPFQESPRGSSNAFRCGKVEVWI